LRGCELIGTTLLTVAGIGNGWKLKGMHWRTFKRLNAEHDAFVVESLAGVARCFGMFGVSGSKVRLGMNLFCKSRR